ncbi:MAG: hypothetical protein EXR08_06050 [Alphaproteobacteria bacterium]|nr:hypothetical protein [Alphaproteobacteria bacterium]
MINAARALIGLVVLFNLALGVGFLFDPARSAAMFFLTPEGVQGLATLRADFSSFFLVAAGFAAYGAWKQASPPLLVPIALFSIAILGRALSLVADGVTQTAFTPMIVEAIMISILMVVWRSFGK